eukprot:923745_1
MTIAGNYYDYDTWGSLGWQSEYSWTTDGCSNSDSTFGGLSITCLLISLITNMILIYWMIKRKNTDKLSIGPCALEQRHILIIICSLMFLLLLASSSAYFSNCNEALWSASTSYESSYYVDWGPDYGLILAWVQCALLLGIVVVNVVAWTKEQTDAQVEINSNPKTGSDAVVVISPTPSALPYGWSEHTAADGRVYYQDNINKRTQWLPPTEEVVLDGWCKRVTPDGKEYWVNSLSKATQWERPTMETKGCGEREGVEPNNEKVPLSAIGTSYHNSVLFLQECLQCNVLPLKFIICV